MIELIILLAIVLAITSIKVVMQYQEGVVFTLGKFSRLAQPGLNFVIPVIQEIRYVDKRITTIDIPKQEVMTKDNVPLGVNGVVFYRVEDAKKAILEIENYHYAIAQYAQTALRDVIGGKELDTILINRDEVADEIKAIVDKETSEWGVDITNIKIQDIELPADMKRVMAKQAEAERDKRAKIIDSEAEFAAAQKVAEAAKLLASTPGGLHLKTLLTISDVAAYEGNSIVFVTPIEVIEAMKGLAKKSEAKGEKHEK
ncbi:MAG: SPFH domain-containing protein [Candidatus Micrarchaeota archaeon]|nr:SPFH domain-containing protein [Candidatus Micrarchaeota archaeon]